ncbi:DUF2911 domain-containing protein [Jiulongibacter sediminis]|jgi:tetratricopeptide (TPR) repeat protein|uniref:DUF2911 domain-containing protein n=1 Tax=Jiulongibacter sediminis TaxID=1605367 RepID=UPI0026F0D509|nr:DUF2911 domain-containing protein [Jiulongibacter sediminis]
MKKLLTLLILSLSMVSYAQEIHFPDLSPQAFVKQEIGNTNFELSYSRPAVRGRKIFGGLVPYGEVWRTGAAWCSTLSFDKEVNIEGVDIPAGKYSILSIPRPTDWVIILNKDTTLYGAYKYNKELDVARFQVASKKISEVQESLSMEIDFVPNHALLTISWEFTEVSFLIKTSTHQEMESYIADKLLTRIETDDDNYIQAAEYLLLNSYDLDQSFQLLEYALEIRDSENVRGSRAAVLLQMGRKDDAEKEIQTAIALVKASDSMSERDKKVSIDYWESRLTELN